VSTTAAETASWLRARDAKRRATAVARADRLLGLLPGVVTELKTRFDCRKVILFGSLATGDVHPDSDVDLWVEGLEAPRHFEAVAAASARLGVQVDLVRAEDAPDSLRARVADEGKAL